MIRYVPFYLNKFLPHISAPRNNHLYRSLLTGLLLPDRPPLPVFLQVEPTTQCNFRCSHCARHRFQMEEAHFSLETYEKLLDQHPSVAVLLLQGQGEPLLCPDFFEMVSMARKKKIYAATCTNGSMVLRYADRIMESGLNYLAYSIDAVGSDAVRFRAGTRWESIEAGAAMLHSRDDGRMTRAVWTTVHKGNLSRIGDVFAWGVEKGCTAFNLQLLQGYRAAPREEPSLTCEEGMAAYDRLKEAVRGRSGIIISHSPFSNRQRRSHCTFPWTGSYLDVRGNVRPCCVAFEDEYIMGNVHAEPFIRIWHNGRFTDFRRRLKSATPPPCCTACRLR